MQFKMYLFYFYIFDFIFYFQKHLLIRGYGVEILQETPSPSVLCVYKLLI